MNMTRLVQGRSVGLTVVLALTCSVSSWVAAQLRSESQWQRFAVYYSDKAPISAFEPYQLIVLDSDVHPRLHALADRRKTLLGYLSLGEVAQRHNYFKRITEEGIVLQENPIWKGSYFIDLRDRRWTKRVIEELIPQILARGFDGLFLDTLDNAAHLERVDPEQFGGMKKAAIELVQSIRHHYPALWIMMNRGYEILPELASSIDMVLGESLYADFNFERKVYERVETDLYRRQCEVLRSAAAQNPDLKVFTLDYWDPDDEEEIAKIYKLQRENGFIPYVATVELDRLVPEP